MNTILRLFVVLALSRSTSAASLSSTLLRFSRKFSTCDASSDVDITAVTSRLIWAYGGSRPSGDGRTSGVGYHVDRGSVSMRLRSEEEQIGPTDNPLQSIDFVVDDVTVTATDTPDSAFLIQGVMIDNGNVVEGGEKGTTSYWCRGVNTTQLEGDFHAVGFEPIVTEGNEKKVHHILLYECPGMEKDKEAAEYSGNCWTDDTPRTVKNCNFGSVVSAWAVGGEPMYFPPEAGLRVGKAGKGGGYYMMEIHYDNYDASTFADSSGLRMLYTPTLRDNDVGVMYTGALPGIDIPPNEEHYDLNARCPWGCTANVPEGGVRVFNSLLHAHTAGVSVRASLLDKRGNFKASLGVEDYYDFNYQSPIPLDVVLSKDDEIHTRCTFNTMGRSENTKFGLATGDEMCLTYLWYYPAIEDSDRCLFANVVPGAEIRDAGVVSIVPDPYSEGLLPVAICDASFFNLASPNDIEYPEAQCERDEIPIGAEKWLGDSGNIVGNIEDGYDNVEVINDVVFLYYTIDKVNEEIHMAIKAHTEGWVGVGFGGGKMKGSDIVMGWVNDEGGWISDRFAEGNSVPKVDEVQDYYNLAVYSGSCEEGGSCEWDKALANPLKEDIVLGAGAGGIGKGKWIGTLSGILGAMGAANLMIMI